MCDCVATGPAIANDEDLVRIITKASGWLSPDGHVSSAAFNHCYYSVEIVSRTSGPDESMVRVPGACGTVHFNCGCARQEGLDARDERDEAHPDNMAHAHVYLDAPNSQRKKRAKRFIANCSPTVTRNGC